jgi:hypothetical protein
MNRVKRFFRARRYREGRVISFWLGRDLRRDVIVSDASRLDEGIIGYRSRIIGALGFNGEPPPYGKLEHSSIVDFKRKAREWNAPNSD